jgi:hypothetical protein
MALKKTITRAKLLDAVQVASVHLGGLERDDVLAFATHAPRVVAGAWQLITADGERCFCPISGAGVDRLKSGSQNFAIAFDYAIGAKAGSTMLLEVIG